jgi:NAD(P)-dependent dehydrogenase (short-subunit alcohol dehydrogenase family)
MLGSPRAHLHILRTLLCIVVVVTGPSEGGLGAELLITLAPAEPAHYILAGRNEAKIQPVIKKINEVNPNIKTTFVHLELSSLASVRKAAAEINAAVDHIDVLVNNAGAGAFKDHRLSEEGIEMHFAANHLGHFLLTNLVVDKVAKVNGTVINLTSMAYALAEFNEDVNFNVRIPRCLLHIDFD